VHYDIFLEREGVESISVDRMGGAPLDDLAEHAKKVGQNRIQPKNFYGWAVLKVRDAEKSGREVVATPTPQNKWHAAIRLTITENEQKRIQEEHALELASLSRWQDPPDAS